VPLPANESGKGQVEALGVEDVAKLKAQRRLFSEQYAALSRCWRPSLTLRMRRRWSRSMP
jgi:hypothetical protein